MPWIKTATGRHINFINPDPDQIDIRDIVTALSRNHRFGGHSPLKIGQHILEVAALMIDHEVRAGRVSPAHLAEVGLVGLIHDFPEYGVLDIPTPLKRLLGPAYAEIEDRLLYTMLLKWDLVTVYEQHKSLLKMYDHVAVEQEALRYRLDGWFLPESEDIFKEAEFVQTPLEWVTEQDIILNYEVWEQESVKIDLTITFGRFMKLSGREHLLPKWFAPAFSDDCLDFDYMPELIPGARRVIL